MASTDYPIISIDPSKVIFVAVGLALKEAVAKGVLTLEQLNAISARGEEIVNAMTSGKIIDVSKEGLIDIREPNQAEVDELSKDPKKFPMFNKSKKTLDV